MENMTLENAIDIINTRIEKTAGIGKSIKKGLDVLSGKNVTRAELAAVAAKGGGQYGGAVTRDIEKILKEGPENAKAKLIKHYEDNGIKYNKQTLEPEIHESLRGKSEADILKRKEGLESRQKQESDAARAAEQKKQEIIKDIDTKKEQLMGKGNRVTATITNLKNKKKMAELDGVSQKMKSGEFNPADYQKKDLLGNPMVSKHKLQSHFDEFDKAQKASARASKNRANLQKGVDELDSVVKTRNGMIDPNIKNETQKLRSEYDRLNTARTKVDQAKGIANNSEVFNLAKNDIASKADDMVSNEKSKTVAARIGLGSAIGLGGAAAVNSINNGGRNNNQKKYNVDNGSYAAEIDDVIEKIAQNIVLAAVQETEMEKQAGVGYDDAIEKIANEIVRTAIEEME